MSAGRKKVSLMLFKEPYHLQFFRVFKFLFGSMRIGSEAKGRISVFTVTIVFDQVDTVTISFDSQMRRDLAAFRLLHKSTNTGGNRKMAGEINQTSDLQPKARESHGIYMTWYIRLAI